MSLRLHLVGATAPAAVPCSLDFASPALASAPAHRATTSTPHTISADSDPADIAISPSPGKAYVVDDGSVSVVSLLTHQQLAEFATANYAADTLTCIRAAR